MDSETKWSARPSKCTWLCLSIRFWIISARYFLSGSSIAKWYKPALLTAGNLLTLPFVFKSPTIWEDGFPVVESGTLPSDAFQELYSLILIGKIQAISECQKHSRFCSLSALRDEYEIRCCCSFVWSESMSDCQMHVHNRVNIDSCNNLPSKFTLSCMISSL